VTNISKYKSGKKCYVESYSKNVFRHKLQENNMQVNVIYSSVREEKTPQGDLIKLLALIHRHPTTKLRKISNI